MLWGTTPGPNGRKGRGKKGGGGTDRGVVGDGLIAMGDGVYDEPPTQSSMESLALGCWTGIMARTILAFVGLLYRSYFFLGRPSLFPPMSQFPPSVEPSAKTHPQPFTTVKAGSGQGSSSNAPPLVPPDSSSHRRTSSAGTRGGRALTVGFIGGGMMASSLIKGLIKAEVRTYCSSKAK